MTVNAARTGTHMIRKGLNLNLIRLNWGLTQEFCHKKYEHIAWPENTHQAGAFQKILRISSRQCIRQVMRCSAIGYERGVCSHRLLYYRCSKATRACANSSSGKDFSRCSDWKKPVLANTETKLLNLLSHRRQGPSHNIQYPVKKKAINHCESFSFYLPFLLANLLF